jgi:hypothetical protein
VAERLAVDCPPGGVWPQRGHAREVPNVRGSTAVLSALSAAGLTAVLFTATPALGDTPPDNANCLGVVTAQRAVANHDIGEHASSQEEPRLGLGNVAREILGPGAHPGQLGAFLGEIDEDPATNCP